MIRAIRIMRLRIPFKVAFRHAAAERAETASLWVEVVCEQGAVGYGESCPREYVTGENLESAHRFLLRHRDAIRAEVKDLASLRGWMAVHADALDANPAAWCAIELALLDAFAKEADCSVESLLSLPALTGEFRYSAVLGDADAESFGAAARQYLSHGFGDFKVKLSGDAARDRAKLDMLFNSEPGAVRVRVDANNLWESADTAIAFLRGLGHPLFAIEEPIRPNRYAECSRIADALGCPVILDESFLRIRQLEQLGAHPERWLLNLRVSKLGGLLRTLDVVEAARAAGFKLIVGAQVGETSLLTRVALTVAQAANGRLAAQEGAFGTFLLQRDLFAHPVMFGAGGVLRSADYGFTDAPGFGMAPAPDAASCLGALPGT